jgi:GDP-L-fucose synthase
MRNRIHERSLSNNMHQSHSIVVTGGGGLLGTALCSELSRSGFKNVAAPSRSDLNLTDYKKVLAYFARTQPTHVFHLAAAVYGVQGNLDHAGQSFLNNTLINTHVVEACRLAKVEKVLCMGSVCAYPYPPPSGRLLREDEIFSGRPHFAEAAYGHAKRAMLAQLEAYDISYSLAYAYVLSTNLFGPNDTFDTQNGHVIPSLVRKFHEAASGEREVVEVWGDGSSMRDFMYISDAAKCLVSIMQAHTGPINMGTGVMRPIADVVRILGQISGQSSRVVYNTTRPKGHDCAGWDTEQLRATGFRPSISLEEGLELTYKWYQANYHNARRD